MPGQLPGILRLAAWVASGAGKIHTLTKRRYGGVTQPQ